MRKMEFQSRPQLPGTNSGHCEADRGGGMIDTHRDCHGVDLEALLGGCCSSASDEDDKSSASSELVCGSGSGPPPSPVVTDRPSSAARKRGREEEEQEVESRFIKRQKSEDTDDASLVGGFSSPNVTESPPLSTQEDCYLDQSADELQMLCDDFGFEMTMPPEHTQEQQQCSSCSKEGGEEDDSVSSSGSARQSRRRKIKATVKLLREAIPGGDGMDTANVLDEAIHYVKLLQLQVQTLGAKRLAQRAAASAASR